MKRFCVLFVVLTVVISVSGIFHPAYAAKKKILYVNSYHSGYEWTDGIREGILTTLNIQMNEDGSLDNAASDFELRIIEMDTKRNAAEDFIKAAALEVKALIESWKPDAVIASDDNASKFLIVPYFKDADLPFVFCGVNWDASAYGFPASNVTGMIEVILIPQIVETLSQYAKGPRIGYIKGDDESARKDAENFKTKFGIALVEKYVNDFDEWKREYLALQQESDMILVGNFVSVKGFDAEEAQQFIEENTTVPTGNWDEWMTTYTLVTYANKATEQGEWAAQTAKRILEGTSPGDIPLVANKKAKISLNMRLAKKLGILFPIDLIEQATLIQ